jgi:DNA-binding CsgD family transcriptional regulator
MDTERSGTSEVDLRAIVELVADTCAPFDDVSPIERKRRLFERISGLVAACSWVWLIGQIDFEIGDGIVVIESLEGGWNDKRDSNELVATSPRRGIADAFNPMIRAILEPRTNSTRCSEIIDDEFWRASPGGQCWPAVGLDHFIVSFRRLEDSMCSMISFHRREGAPNFSQRERTIVDVLFQGIDWLHHACKGDSELIEFGSLTPRERQVLSLLLKGFALKDVAASLTLSRHTVADHLKEIYRKLGVNSRAELLAKFISGRTEFA